MTTFSNPVQYLRFISAMFALLWTAMMIWWSGQYEAVNIIILTLCGALAGTLWFIAMRWYFRRTGVYPKA